MKSSSASPDSRRSSCPIACVLDVLGDRWTLLVVRDLALGKTRFDEFRQSPEGIASNILAERLKRLEAQGWVSKSEDPADGRRFCYALTEQGKELRKLLRAVGRWGLEHLPAAKGKV